MTNCTASHPTASQQSCVPCDAFGIAWRYKFQSSQEVLFTHLAPGFACATNLSPNAAHWSKMAEGI